MAILYSYGHHYEQVHLLARCRNGTSTRSDGAALEGVEVRSPASRDQSGSEPTAGGGPGNSRGPRSIAGLVDIDAGRRETLGEKRKERTACFGSQVRASNGVIYLDTSFLIRGLVRGSPQDRLLREWLSAGEPLGMNAIAWAEFLCGPIQDQDFQLATQVIAERADFTEDHALTAARLFNESGRHRGTLVDCMIASAALPAYAPLATENVADFRRFGASGLKILQADPAS